MTKDNLFYLLNFSYIGCSIALGLTLYIKQYKHERRVTQLLVGLYMLLYLGVICNENMQIEGFLQIHMSDYGIYETNELFSFIRIKCDTSKCISCGKCKKVCPMDVDMTDNSKKRQNGTDCILCFECTKVCPKNAL